MKSERALWVVMYHYVRDLERSSHPRIKGLTVDRFRAQLGALRGRFEMATLESALSYLDGRYDPSNDLCLLTFDDGLTDHHRTVWPLLAESGLQGVFFVSTGHFDGSVASVHKNHVLLASNTIGAYRAAVLEALAADGPDVPMRRDLATAAYRWDEPEVAEIKYLVNFQLDPSRRDQLIDRVFAAQFGDEHALAREWYLTWDDARAMQAAGMAFGGHAHRHVALATLDNACQASEIETCRQHLERELRPQALWPFSYPYGSYDATTRRLTASAGFACSFTTEPGSNDAGADPFALRRIDTNDVVMPGV